MAESIDKSNSHAQTATNDARSKSALSQPRVQLHWPENTQFRILSIDGGGIKGIFPATVLSELERQYLNGESIANYFDLIVGTSTGGVIALGLGAGLSARDLRDLYRDRGREIFPPLGKIANVAAAARRVFKYGYDRETLRDVLHDLVGDKTLAQSQKRLCVASSEAEHGDVYVFKTPHHPDYKLDAKEKMLKVALSTSAAPTFFRVLEDDGYKFVDGGIWANNPTMIGLVEALSAFDVQRDQIKILSLGCGSRPFRASQWKIRFGGMFAWWDIIFAAMYFQSVTALDQSSLLIGNDRITRIDAPLTDRPIGLDDWLRSTTELMPAAVEVVQKSGDVLATTFLGSRVQPFRPAHTTIKSTHGSIDDETDNYACKEANSET